MVPAGTPGFRVSQKYSKVGWSASDTRELFFDDVRVPAANLVGSGNETIATGAQRALRAAFTLPARTGFW